MTTSEQLGQYFYKVSCTSPTFCVAVGANGYGPTLAEKWDGTSWSPMTTPTPTNGGGFLHAVSCTSATNCIAVGAANAGPNSLAEHWDGSSWSVMTTTNPGALLDVLYGVSCSSASDCMAVGYSVNRSGDPVSFYGSYQILAEHWDGSSWSTTTPAPTLNVGDLTLNFASAFAGVSCTSPTNCVAAGYNHGAQTRADQWNGSSWSTMSTTNPGYYTPDYPVSSLFGVSCTSENFCVAVGDYYRDRPPNQAILTNYSQTLAEVYYGKVSGPLL
jgi:hypothetical protein